jgi:hypothetical protein
MPRRYAVRDRRERDREQRRSWANRRVGQDHAYFILFWEPILKVAVPLVFAVAGAVWLWFSADHKVIGFVAAVAGLALLAFYAASTVAATGPQARQMARATGKPARPSWHHLAGAAGLVLLALAYVAIPHAG